MNVQYSKTKPWVSVQKDFLDGLISGMAFFGGARVSSEGILHFFKKLGWAHYGMEFCVSKFYVHIEEYRIQSKLSLRTLS